MHIHNKTNSDYSYTTITYKFIKLLNNITLSHESQSQINRIHTCTSPFNPEMNIQQLTTKTTNLQNITNTPS